MQTGKHAYIYLKRFFLNYPKPPQI